MEHIYACAYGPPLRHPVGDRDWSYCYRCQSFVDPKAPGECHANEPCHHYPEAA